MRISLLQYQSTKGIRRFTSSANSEWIIVSLETTRMKKFLFFLVFVALCTVGGIWFWNQQQQNSPGSQKANLPVTSEVVRGSIEEKVIASGKILPRGGVRFVVPEIEGKVKSIRPGIKEGVRVVAGQPMVDLIDTAVQLEVRAAQDLVNSAAELANTSTLLVEKASAEKEQNDLKLKSATERFESELKRNEGSIPTSTFKAASLDLDIAKAGMKLADLAIKDANSKVALANLNVDKAKTGLDAAKEKLKQYTINAPENGIILRMTVKENDIVSPKKSGDPSLFLLVQEANSWELQAQVSEQDIGKIEAGQNVRFSVEAYAERKDISFTGKVVKKDMIPSMNSRFSGLSDINPAALAMLGGGGGSQQTNYTVTVSVDPVSSDGKSNHQLAIWMNSSNVNIIIEKRENALIVNSAALGFTPETLDPKVREQIQEKEKEGYLPVWTFDDGRYSPIFVKAGATEGGKTEILESLDNQLKEKKKLVIEAPPKTEAGGLFGGSVKFKL